MSRRQLVEQALQTINQLPDDRISEVVDFAAYILKKHEESVLQKGIEQLVRASSSFAFLNEEEDLYTIDDLKERYQ
ncbi:hypothetical protein [Spirosoma fluminis]